MKYVALISGGKDSCYTILELHRQGHELICLANLHPCDSKIDEIDSFMYQSVASDVVPLIAECLDKPLFRHQTYGRSINQMLQYEPTEDDEVEDLYFLLKEVKTAHPDVRGVSSGAIHSTYQRTRVENVCNRLNLTSMTPLWMKDQAILMQDMISSRMNSVLVKVATLGLNPKLHLGKSISDVHAHFQCLNARYGFHICGEGGEYETITLDFPLYLKRLVIDKFEVMIHSDDALAPVGYLQILQHHFEEKTNLEIDLDVKAISAISCPDSSASNEISRLLGTFEFVNEGSDPSLPPISHTLNPKVFRCIEHAYYSSGHVHVSGIKSHSAGNDSNSSAATQLTSCIEELKLILQKFHMDLTEVIFVHLYIANIDHFEPVNAEYSIAFQHANISPPSRCCVQLNLPKPYLILIDCIAQRQSKHQTSNSQNRSTLLVRSLSPWAPVCIGPYSQLNSLCQGSLIFLSGMIGLLPSTMTMPLGGFEEELGWCFRNACQVLQSSQSSISRGALCITLYITYPTNAQHELTWWNRVHALVRYLAFRNGGIFDHLGENLGSNSAEEGYDSEAEEEEIGLKMPGLRNIPVLIVGVERLPKNSLCELEVLALSHAAISMLQHSNICFTTPKFPLHSPQYCLPDWVQMPFNWVSPQQKDASSNGNTSDECFIQVDGVIVPRITCQAFCKFYLNIIHSFENEIISITHAETEEVLLCLLKAVLKALEFALLEWCHLASIRVYHLSSFDGSFLKQSLLVGLKTMTSSRPAVTCLPVNTLGPGIAIVTHIFALDLPKMSTELWVQNKV